MLSRNTLKLNEAKHNLELFSNNVESREKLIEKGRSELLTIEAFLNKHEREERDLERNHDEVQRLYVEIEKKFKTIALQYKDAVKKLKDSKINPTFLAQRHKRDEVIQNVRGFEKELQLQKNNRDRTANDVRIFEQSVKQETADLTARMRQDQANDNKDQRNKSKVA